MKQPKRFSVEQLILKWSKRHKKRNHIYTIVVLIVAVLIMIFLLKIEKVEPVKNIHSSKEEVKYTYLGNIELSKHIKINNINTTFNSIKNILNKSDFSTASLKLVNTSSNKNKNFKTNINNIKVIKNLNIKSLNLINEDLDNSLISKIETKIEELYGYNFLTGNGSNLINSKTVQDKVKGKRVVNISFSDINSNYTSPLKNSTSISLQPDIFIPLIKNLKKNNDFVIVNVDWGIPDEQSVTDRQREYAHALSKAGADVIIGHNTVIQEIEKYKDTNIFYSLGNATSESFLSKNKQGLTVQQSWNGKTSKFLITPIKFQGGKISEAQPTKIEEIKLLNNLNKNHVNLKKVNGGYEYEN